MDWLTNVWLRPLLIVIGPLLSGFSGLALQSYLIEANKSGLPASIDSFLVLGLMLGFLSGPFVFGAGIIAFCMRWRDRQRFGKCVKGSAYPWESEWESAFGFRTRRPSEEETVSKGSSNRE